MVAVDRAGAGEIHIVEVKKGIQDWSLPIAQLMKIPSHYKYLALIGNANYRPTERILYAPDGMGRVGVIEIREDNRGCLHAQLTLRPERFRPDPSIYQRIDRFTAANPADIEVRP